MAYGATENVNSVFDAYTLFINITLSNNTLKQDFSHCKSSLPKLIQQTGKETLRDFFFISAFYNYKSKDKSRIHKR